jgi:glycosyltransferase involved in cell wall biosynthesis
VRGGVAVDRCRSLHLPDQSVIIPTHNRAAFLPACVLSLRSCGISLEIVIVDDGSTDETAAVVAELGRDIVYVRQTNSGIGSARNAGIARAAGRYLAYLDSDDFWLPAVAPKLVQFLDRCPEVDAIFTDALVGNDRDGFQFLLDTLDRKRFDGLPDRSPETGFRILERRAFFRLMLERNQIFLGTLIHRREVFDRIAPFDLTARGAEDYELCLRLSHEFTIAFGDEPLARYIKHDLGMSADHDKMAEGFALALTSGLAKSPPHDSDDLRIMRRQLQRQRYRCGYNAFSRGDHARARHWFRQILWSGPDPVNLALWALCHFPARWVGRLRRARRVLTGAAAT